MEWSEKNNGPSGTGFMVPVHPSDAEGVRQFPNGWRPQLIFDPTQDPAHPWVTGTPMHLKITFQTEAAFGAGWAQAPVPAVTSLNIVSRKITYLGSDGGRPGYMSVAPIRLTDPDARFMHGAFQGGVNHYSPEGERVGLGGERLLFRNYRPFRLWERWTGEDPWRRDVFRSCRGKNSSAPCWSRAATTGRSSSAPICSC